MTSQTGKVGSTADGILFVILHGGREIGVAGFVGCDAFDGRDVQILWALRESDEGNGFAREACKNALEWAFAVRPWPRILGLVHRENVRSRKLVEFLKMKELGPRPNSDETVFEAQP